MSIEKINEAYFRSGNANATKIQQLKLKIEELIDVVTTQANVISLLEEKINGKGTTKKQKK